MRRTATVLALSALLLAVGCTVEEDPLPAAPANLGKLANTVFCPGCGFDVNKGHVHPEPVDPDDPDAGGGALSSVRARATFFCELKSCGVAASVDEHNHGRTQLCDDCGWEVAKDAVDHRHGRTRYCAICGREAAFDAGTGLWGEHVHKTTIYCPTCDQEVTVRGDRPDPAHVHGQTQYCPVCRLEVALDYKGHIHGKTQYCLACGREAAVDVEGPNGLRSRGHIHDDRPDATVFCPVCMTEVPAQPGTSGVSVDWTGGDATLPGHEHSARTKSGEVRQQVRDVLDRVQGDLLLGR